MGRYKRRRNENAKKDRKTKDKKKHSLDVVIHADECGCCKEGVGCESDIEDGNNTQVPDEYIETTGHISTCFLCLPKDGGINKRNDG
jgi:hypothetical protein